MLAFFQHEDGFNFQPLVSNNSISVLLPDNVSASFVSGDPGLEWKQDTCAMIVSQESINQKNFGFQIQPNPVNQEAFLYFQLKQPSKITLLISDISGRKLRQIENEKYYLAGEHSRFLQTDYLFPGLYFITIEVNGKRQTRKFIKM